MAELHGVDTAAGRNDAADEAFKTWCFTNGVLAPKLLYPFYSPEGYRGVGAAAAICSDEALIEVPARLLLTPSVAHADERIGHVFSTCSDIFSDEDVVLGTYLAYQKSIGSDSFFAPWLACMPTELESLSSWSAAELEELQDDALSAQAEEQRDYLRDVGRDVFKALRVRFSHLFSIECSAELISWGVQTVGARAYGRRLAEPALVPLADAFNHANVRVKYGVVRCAAAHTDISAAVAHTDDAEAGAHSNLAALLAHSSISSSSSETDGAATTLREAAKDAAALAARRQRNANAKALPPDGVFRLWTSNGQTFPAGVEVNNSYGRRTNGELALSYGFVMEDNHHEAVTLQPGAVGDVGRLAAIANPTTITGVPALASDSRGRLTAVKRAALPRLGLAHAVATAPWNVWCGESFLPLFRLLACCDDDARRVLAAAAATARDGGGSKARSGSGGASTAEVPCETLRRPLGLANEVAALQLAEAYLETVLTFPATTLEEDEALLRGAGEGGAAPAIGGYRHRVALQYRITRKRIVLQQREWTQALLSLTRLQLQRVARIDAPSYPPCALRDAATEYAAAVSAVALTEVAARLGCQDSIVGRALDHAASALPVPSIITDAAAAGGATTPPCTRAGQTERAMQRLLLSRVQGGGVRAKGAAGTVAATLVILPSVPSLQ